MKSRIGMTPRNEPLRGFGGMVSGDATNHVMTQKVLRVNVTPKGQKGISKGQRAPLRV